MPQQLLHVAQIGATLEQVSRGAVAQCMWADVRGSGHAGGSVVHHAADGSWVDAATAPTEEQRWTTAIANNVGAAAGQP